MNQINSKQTFTYSISPTFQLSFSAFTLELRSDADRLSADPGNGLRFAPGHRSSGSAIMEDTDVSGSSHSSSNSQQPSTPINHNLMGIPSSLETQDSSPQPGTLTGMTSPGIKLLIPLLWIILTSLFAGNSVPLLLTPTPPNSYLSNHSFLSKHRLQNQVEDSADLFNRSQAVGGFSSGRDFLASTSSTSSTSSASYNTTAAAATLSNGRHSSKLLLTNLITSQPGQRQRQRHGSQSESPETPVLTLTDVDVGNTNVSASTPLNSVLGNSNNFTSALLIPTPNYFSPSFSSKTRGNSNSSARFLGGGANSFVSPAAFPLFPTKPPEGIAHVLSGNIADVILMKYMVSLRGQKK